MRIWDINPGYLNRQSLLGEHRELHGIVSIITQKKKGYAKHPETLRWPGHGWALKQRHRLLAAEMTLRGYTDRSPVLMRSRKNRWPGVYIDSPHRQFHILSSKYRYKDQGRIPYGEIKSRRRQNNIGRGDCLQIPHSGLRIPHFIQPTLYMFRHP